MNQRVTKTCPYLGLLIDPETISAEADPVNHCHVHKTPKSVELDYQNKFCLSGHFTECAIYTQFITQGLSSTIIENTNDEEIHEEESIEELPQEEELIGTAAPLEEDKELSNQTDDWRRKLRQDAQSNYDEISSKKSRTGLWVFLFLVAVGILAVSVWGIINRFPTGEALAQQGNGSETSGSSLATTVSEMGSAADAWATAASAIELGSSTQAANERATSTAIAILAQQAVQATQEAQQAQVVACVDLSSTEFMIVDGPTFEPGLGYQHVAESEIVDVEASWLIENSANCIWENIYLLSLSQAEIITPTLRVNGEDVLVANPDGSVFVEPEQRIEVVLALPVENATEEIDEEYVLMINGLTLIDQPHLFLQVEGWVKIVKPTSIVPLNPTPTPTKKSSEGSGGSSGRPAPPTPERP